MDLLLQPHNFRFGDRVSVIERYTPNISYDGTIHSIVKQPSNKNPFHNSNDLVDYFYVKLDEAAYAKLLKRGSEIIYENRTTIVGSIWTNTTCEQIERITSQQMFSTTETQLDPKNIDAMLIWRIGYNIVKT